MCLADISKGFLDFADFHHGVICCPIGSLSGCPMDSMIFGQVSRKGQVEVSYWLDLCEKTGM